jgi:translation elongation factor EF-Ts
VVFAGDHQQAINKIRRFGLMSAWKMTRRIAANRGDTVLYVSGY